MTVKELIQTLEGMTQTAEVYCEYRGPGGCDTCGAGSETEDEVVNVRDLDTRVVLSLIG